MPQALIPLCLAHFLSWENFPLSVLAFWGNKNWPPSIKVKKLENLWNKISSTCSKWSVLNSPDNQTSVDHLLGLLYELPNLSYPNCISLRVALFDWLLDERIY